MSTTGIFDGNQPTSSSVEILAVPPCLAASISFCPSALLTAALTIFGRRGRSSSPGVPQIVLTVPQWARSPGLTATTPAAPAVSYSATALGRAKPSVTTMRPWKRPGSSRVPADRSSGLPAPVAGM